MVDNKVASLVFTPVDDKFQNVLYLNAMPCDGSEKIEKKSLSLYQTFRPYYEQLLPIVSPELPDKTEKFDAVFILGTKNSEETKYFIARAVEYLKEGGLLSICAENKMGGNRLVKLLQQANLAEINSYSKHKSRVAWGRKEKTNRELIQQWIQQGSMQKIAQGQFQSQPGIFGWDKIDRGSQLLIEHLPNAGPQGQSKIFKGRGADFGCGYGYLTHALLSTYASIKHMTCLDADYRAVEACRLNTQKISDTECEYVWADLIQPTPLKNLDFIIMNPPFHEGKSTDQSIGRAFIQNAATSLKKHGQLWMVANAHLSYEKVLEDNFHGVTKIFEGQGFKILQAEK